MFPGMEVDLGQFELRKKDHIVHSLKPSVDVGDNGLKSIHLIHEALPEINFSDVELKQSLLGHTFASPLFISSMTAGHSEADELNYTLAECCSEKNWLFAVGSQSSCRGYFSS